MKFIFHTIKIDLIAETDSSPHQLEPKNIFFDEFDDWTCYVLNADVYIVVNNTQTRSNNS